MYCGWYLGIVGDSSVHLRTLFGCCWSLVVVMGSVMGMLMLLLIIRGSLTSNWSSSDTGGMDSDESEIPVPRSSSKSDNESRIKRRKGMLSIVLLIVGAVIAWNTVRWYSIAVIVYLVLALLVACYKAGLQQGGKENGKDGSE